MAKRSELVVPCRTARALPMRPVCAASLPLVLAFAPAAALAHVASERPHGLASSPWSFEPWVVACLAVSAALYALGLVRLWRRAGRGHGVRASAAAEFGAGWLTLAVALLSPVDTISEALFSMHMVQHELLMIVAAPLLVLGRPLAVWVWALPPTWRSGIGAFFHRPAWRVPWLALTAPLSAWTLHALALWLWHVPVLFEAALASEWVHALQHIAFLGTALLFWWSVLGGVTRRDRGVALLSLFTTMVHTGALGALFTLSTVVWYPSYAASAGAFGLTPLEDQQLGGIVMWVPAGFVYLACALVLAGRWLGEPRRVPVRAG